MPKSSLFRVSVPAVVVSYMSVRVPVVGTYFKC
jgi:hypothetical protein